MQSRSKWEKDEKNMNQNKQETHLKLTCRRSFPLLSFSKLQLAKNTPKISVKQPWKTSSSAVSNFYLPPLWFSLSKISPSTQQNHPLSSAAKNAPPPAAGLLLAFSKNPHRQKNTSPLSQKHHNLWKTPRFLQLLTSPKAPPSLH